MSLRDELAEIKIQIEKLEERQREIYEVSLLAPLEEKVIEDHWARMLSEPSPPSKRPTWHITDVVWEEGGVYQNFRGGIKLVAIRPVGEGGVGKETYLGIYIGDFATGASCSYHDGSGVLTLKVGHHNPAIFVPKLNRVVFGYESWWCEIKSEADFKQITTEDIENVWYVKLMRERTEEPQK